MSIDSKVIGDLRQQRPDMVLFHEDGRFPHCRLAATVL